MNLTTNFTLEELTATSTGLPNLPDRQVKGKLLYLASYLLQPIRDKWGPLTVTSGFRGVQVNAAVGSKPTSQHLQGEAADFTTQWLVQLDVVYGWIVKESGLAFGQCIRESSGGKDWIHISLPRLDRPNQQALIFDGKDYQPYG